MTTDVKQGFQAWCHHAVAPALVKRSIKTAVVVGTLLNIINQWPALLGQTHLVWSSFLLTFLVPYCVSTYSGAMAAMHQQQGCADKQGSNP